MQEFMPFEYRIKNRQINHAFKWQSQNRPIDSIKNSNVNEKSQKFSYIMKIDSQKNEKDENGEYIKKP